MDMAHCEIFIQNEDISVVWNAMKSCTFLKVWDCTWFVQILVVSAVTGNWVLPATCWVLKVRWDGSFFHIPWQSICDPEQKNNCIGWTDFISQENL